MILPLEYVAGMKLISSREQDIKNVASIILLQKSATPEDLKNKVSKYGFEDIDESVLLEAFGEAYGMDWLEKYYVENEDKFQF